MTTSDEVVEALNRVLSRVGVGPVRSIREFDSVLLLRIFRRLFIGLPSEVLSEPTTRQDHAANFTACLDHLSKSVLMMDLSHIDGAALARSDLEATRNLLEILDELHEIFQQETQRAPSSPKVHSTPPRRVRGVNSPETAPRTHSRTRTKPRTRSGMAEAGGSSSASALDEDDLHLGAERPRGGGVPWHEAESEENGADMSPWEQSEGSFERLTDGIRRSPPYRAAIAGTRALAEDATRRTKGLGMRAAAHPGHRTGQGRLDVRMKGGFQRGPRRVEHAHSARAQAVRPAAPVRRLDMGAGGAALQLQHPYRTRSASRVRAHASAQPAGQHAAHARASSAPRAVRGSSRAPPVSLLPTSWAHALAYGGVETDVRELTAKLSSARARSGADAHPRARSHVSIEVGSDPRSGLPLAVAASATHARAGADADADADADESCESEAEADAWAAAGGAEAAHSRSTPGAEFADDATARVHAVYANLLRQHSAELNRAEQQQRLARQLHARNALRDERSLRARGERALSELETRGASLASHRASAGFAYRRQLHRLALKLQRERGWLEQGAEASRAFSHLRASELRQSAAESYYAQQIAALEEQIRAAHSDRQTRERAQQQLLRSVEHEVYEQQVASVKAVQRQLEQLDTVDQDYDWEKGQQVMHSLNKSARVVREQAWRRANRWPGHW